MRAGDELDEDAPRKQRWVGTASREDCRHYIRPLLEREGIPYLPFAQSLGLIEIGTNTPANVQRARALIRRDAEEKRYSFCTRIEPEE